MNKGIVVVLVGDFSYVSSLWEFMLFLLCLKIVHYNQPWAPLIRNLFTKFTFTVCVNVFFHEEQFPSTGYDKGAEMKKKNENNNEIFWNMFINFS